MRKFLVIPLLFIYFSAISQNDNSKKTLLSIDNKKISVGEFKRIYKKNNENPSYDKVSIREYLELFIHFKLKVIDAEKKGMDTLTPFKTEMQGYRNILEKPYLTDKKTDEELIKEAYERMKWNIKASHILISCPENASPEDTLKAYEKIKYIRTQAIKNNVNFTNLAKKYSDDPSAKQNNGSLGYFTVFQMVYPFESAAYNTKKGEISNILRTRFGYHILKVDDKKANQGSIKVAHLMLAIPYSADETKQNTAKEKVYQIYDSIIKGANFSTMVKKYSDDMGTKQKGGELPYFEIGRMVPEFEKAAFAIKKIEDYSKPVRTNYGWHIIKLLDLKPIESFDKVEKYIKDRVAKDMRAGKGRKNLIAKLKKEYNFKENRDNITIFYKLIEKEKQNISCKPIETLQKTLFTLLNDNIKYKQIDFCKYLSDNKKYYPQNITTSALVNNAYEKYKENKIIAFEKTQLEKKYPEFKYLLQEYHDGILLFNLSDQEVWSKATNDTLGIEKFYKQHKNNYLWGKRTLSTIYTFNNKKYLPKIEKLAEKIAKKNKNINKEIEKFKTKINKKDTNFELKAVQNKYLQGDNQWIDKLKKTKGLSNPIEENGNIKLIYINGEVPPEPKLINEVRGLIIADYQNELEKNWIKKLKQKYKVEINEKVLKEIIKP